MQDPHSHHAWLQDLGCCVQVGKATSYAPGENASIGASRPAFGRSLLLDRLRTPIVNRHTPAEAGLATSWECVHWAQPHWGPSIGFLPEFLQGIVWQLCGVVQQHSDPQNSHCRRSLVALNKLVQTVQHQTIVLIDANIGLQTRTPCDTRLPQQGPAADRPRVAKLGNTKTNFVLSWFMTGGPALRKLLGGGGACCSFWV